MNNISLVEKYLVEIRNNIKRFIKISEDIYIPHDCIKGVLELLICVDGTTTMPQEALDLIYAQVPELFHCREAVEFVENLAQLFSGMMNQILENEGERFTQMAKNITQEEINRLEIIYKLYEDKEVANMQDDNLVNILENININNK